VSATQHAPSPPRPASAAVRRIGSMRGCMALRAAQASALPAQRTRADRAATRAVPLPPHHARTAPRRAAAAPASPASPRPAAALPAWASGFAPAARSPAATRSAAATVRAFYAAVNARQLDAAMAYIEDECVYEDMIYSAPFVGKDAVAAHFASVCRILPADASFVVRAFAVMHDASRAER
jgi:hypothetical protein